MQDPEQLFNSEDRVYTSLSVGASRDLFVKADIAYKIVHLASIPFKEVVDRIIKDLQIDLNQREIATSKSISLAEGRSYKAVEEIENIPK